MVGKKIILFLDQHLELTISQILKLHQEVAAQFVEMTMMLQLLCNVVIFYIVIAIMK